MENNKRKKFKEEEFLTPKDIQERMKLSQTTVWRLMNVKGFPAIRIGKNIRIRESDFEKFLETYDSNKINLSQKKRHPGA